MKFPSIIVRRSCPYVERNIHDCIVIIAIYPGLLQNAVLRSRNIA